MVVQPPALFGTLGQDVDPVYRNIRDSPRLTDARQFAESLWLGFYPLADPHFVDQFARSCFSRFWEMYLGSTLPDAGFCPSSTSAGPDLSIQSPAGMVHFEAVAPSSGDGSHPDVVPEIECGVAQRVPVEKVLLRCRAALEEKHRKHFEFLDSGSLSRVDPYVIAVNVSNVRFARWIDHPPLGVQTVFPIGEQTVVFSSDPEVDGQTYFTHRAFVTKSSGASVTTGVFVDPAYSEISAVLFSQVDPANYPDNFGDDFVLIHNPSAKNPLPMGFLPRGREFVAWPLDDEYSVACQDWRRVQ
jgi:hypothetical protein